MKYITNKKLTPSQANSLVHQGFILQLVAVLGSLDEYRVFVIDRKAV